ncbi:Nucleic acid-binding protein [Corchorus olitorius]|uniref:Nucleic acid-binding protein n=1 Tax=Corchorus olitorius TaxID=93759 RepID=A0A1R3G8X2_9ROSI|nr:Nucleic acid-binding protein [Corchorus olitorius]
MEAGIPGDEIALLPESKLSQLRDDGQRCAIVIKILRLWDSIIPPKNIFAGLDFLAADSEGFTMHGTIASELADDFRPKIKEGHFYKITIFEVGHRNKKTHLAVPLETILVFNVSTVIEEITEGTSKFPPHHFRFADYHEIMARNEKLYYLTDIIGVLGSTTDVKAIELQNHQRTVDKRDIFLTLLSGDKIKITIWDPKIMDLNITAPFVYSPLIDNKLINTCSATKFYLEPDIPEVVEIRKRIPDDGKPIELISSSDVDALNQFTYPDVVEKTIKDLLFMNPAVIKVKGQVLRFQTKQGWYYNSCPDCTFAVSRRPSGYHCNKHGDTPVAKLSLKISIIIQHAGFKVQTIIFGNPAKRLTGMDISSLTLDEKMNLEEVPAIANQILNKHFEFILGVSNQAYGPGLNFKIFHFNPLESEPKLPTPCKDKEHTGPSIDAKGSSQTKVNYTPQTQGDLSGCEGTPSATPPDNVSQPVEKPPEPSAKRPRTW